MRKMCLAILLCAFLVVCGFALATSSVPERNQESEQRIDSMMVNQSFGNMTDEDYIIALMYAYINDTINSNSINNRTRPNFSAVMNEAISKFGYYSEIYTSDKLETEFRSLMSDSRTSECYVDEQGSSRCNGRYTTPEQGRIDLSIYCLFHNDTECKMVYSNSYSTGFSDDLNEARVRYQSRIAEEKELKAKREKIEADRLLKQLENEARQAALDAHYKALYENTTKELNNLASGSTNVTYDQLADVLRLVNNSSKSLVSPYSNMMMVREGDILVQMSMLKGNQTNIRNIALAFDRYNSALTNFTYSNDSSDYQNGIYQDFADKYIGLIDVKKGIAEDRLMHEIYALGNDLRDAPNAEQLLSGRIDKKYELMTYNFTDPLIRASSEHPGYLVQVNLSAYNDPESSNTDEYVIQNIPTFIDIFSSLFRDDRISVVFVQLNETYYDRFGHTEERPIMIASLNNVTATEIGDWPAFKKYIGKDMERFKQVVEVSY